MESGFLTFILVSSSAVYSSHFGTTEWDDVVVAREGMPVTLPCIDTTVRGAVVINWMVKSLGADEWKLALLANQRNGFSGGASKASMRLTDPNFQDTKVFSLFFIPKMEDSGLYSCLIMQEERKLKGRTILLAILTVTVYPPAPIPQQSTLRLIARVNPDFAITKITWAAPGSISMKTEKHSNKGIVAKLPHVQNSDNGAYICMVHPKGNSSKTLFAFNVNMTVDADNVISFTNVTHGPLITTATHAQAPFTLTCPGVQGDYVNLHWQPPDNRRQNNMKLLYQYDRWRGSTLLTDQSKRIQLAGPPYSAEAGSFSFLLSPWLKEGGLYICDVFLDDSAHSQRTLLSVLKVKASQSSSKLELVCLYSERSQVQSANWKYQNKSRRLPLLSSSPGSIITIVPMPITSETAGNYTCTLQLKNGQTIWATHTVTMPHEVCHEVVCGPFKPTPEHVSVFPSLFALLLLVPLVAAAVGVLLWRQKHFSERGIEQSLSVHSGEAENIYEDPEDIRQAPPQGSVYMDLKPRGEDDVYKELEQFEQCQT